MTSDEIHQAALKRAREEFPHVREQVREMYRRDPFYDPEVRVGNLDLPSIGDLLKSWWSK